MIFMIYCPVDEQRGHLRSSLRNAHLEYVSGQMRLIVYGGVVESSATTLRRVVYFVEVDSEADAWSFVEGDPYNALYDEIEVLEFQQRISRTAGKALLKS